MPQSRVTDKSLSLCPVPEQLHHPSLFHLPGTFTALPGVTFPHRISIIRLSDHRLIIYNAPNPDLLDHDAIRSLGQVYAIVSPNVCHGTYAQSMKDAFPDALLLSSPALKNRFPMREWGTVVDETTEESLLGDEITIRCLSRMKPFQEIILLHKPSKTLFIADMAFNNSAQCLERCGASRLAKWYLWLVDGMNCLDTAWTLGLLIKKHAKEGLTDYEGVLELEFENVVPTHGDVVLRIGRQRLENGAVRRVKRLVENESFSGMQWLTVSLVCIGSCAVWMWLKK